jgi:hypothetical protein
MFIWRTYSKLIIIKNEVYWHQSQESYTFDSSVGYQAYPH